MRVVLILAIMVVFCGCVRITQEPNVTGTSKSMEESCEEIGGNFTMERSPTGDLEPKCSIFGGNDGVVMIDIGSGG